MPKYAEYRAMNLIKTILAFAQFEAAVEAALEELQQRDIRFEGKTFAQWVTRPAFRKAILAHLDAGRDYEGLSFYRRYASQVQGVPENAQQTPTDYLLRLSRSAASLGMPKVASQIAQTYEKIDSKRQAERVIAQAVEPTAAPSNREVEEIDEERRVSEKNYAEARNLWIQEGLGQKKTLASAEKIRAHLAKVTDESSFSYAKELLLGLLDDRTGKPTTALSHALKARLLVVSDEQKPDVDRVDAWIAGLHAKAGAPQAAVDLYRQLEKRMSQQGEKNKPRAEGIASSLGVPPTPKVEELIIAEGEVLAATGAWGEAAQAYSRAVEAGLGGNRVKFEYARALNRTGSDPDRAKARKMLEQIVESKKDDFWRKLAVDSLARQGLETEK